LHRRTNLARLHFDRASLYLAVMAEQMAAAFDCPYCGARYKVVRVEADGVSADRPIACCNCGAPLRGREGKLVVKYFLVRRPQLRAAKRHNR
jgi:hypothetical protein